jgi:ankyrin repeat protein
VRKVNEDEVRWYREVDVRARNQEERTALHGAASEGLWQAVALLIERGADVDARDQFGATPLHLAAGKGCRDAVDVLLKSGASIWKKDDSGQTPLDYARENRHWWVARRLAKEEESRTAQFRR